MKTKLFPISIGFILFGVLIALFFIVSSYIDGYWIFGKNKIDFDVTGQFGDFIGGVVGTIFSLFGTVLIFFSFKEQTKQNRRQAFESKFYELVRIHNDNVKELQFNGSKGRVVFENLIVPLRSIYHETESVLRQLKKGDFKVVDSELKHTLVGIQNHLNDLKSKEIKLLAHQISYGYFFYGRENYFLTNNQEDILYSINSAVANKMKTNRLANIGTDFFNDIQPVNALLGHYFRHLFQIIKLVAESHLIENEKYHYAKITRSLLSDNEQILLYYNSLSLLGKSWITPLNKNEIQEMCFIARFRLIKNIPAYFNYFGIQPGDLFKTEIKAWEGKGEKFFESI